MCVALYCVSEKVVLCVGQCDVGSWFRHEYVQTCIGEYKIRQCLSSIMHKHDNRALAHTNSNIISLKSTIYKHQHTHTHLMCALLISELLQTHTHTHTHTTTHTHIHTWCSLFSSVSSFCVCCSCSLSVFICPESPSFSSRCRDWQKNSKSAHHYV